MSVNKRTLLLHRTTDSENNKRSLNVYEEDTNKPLNVDNSNIVILYPRMYSRITFEYEYKTMSFLWADVYVTNRFTMDTIKETVSFDHAIDTGDAAIYGLANNSLAEPTSYIRVSADTVRKCSIIEVVLSMNDFMYGDIYVQFYDRANEKERYCAPIIVQFTNAPTVLQGGIYKWRPNLAKDTSALYDYDNVFHDGYGAFGPPPQKQCDLGRTDVLTGNASESAKFYYNDFMSTDRLITNGYADYSKSPKRSYSGHPTYVIEYAGIVPSAFSSAFGINQQPVTFVPLNNEQSAYLTSSVDDIPVMYADSKSLTMTSRPADLFFPHSAVQMYSAANHGVATLDCSVVKYIAHLTANSVDRPDDEWFRKHTRVCADFVLSGLDPYWTGESNELPILTTDRLYYVFNNVSYTPNVFELSWFAAGNGTSYYLVKKCPANADRIEWINDTNNWIQVFTKENHPDYLLSDKTICANNKTVMCKENDPVSVQAYNGVTYITDPAQCIYDNIEDIELDNNGHPLIVHENYAPPHILHGSYSFSDNSYVTGHNTYVSFRVMNETVENGLHAVVYRVSDNGDADSNFELDDADAEFAIIYRA
jgi:hypothetical protein